MIHRAKATVVTFLHVYLEAEESDPQRERRKEPLDPQKKARMRELEVLERWRKGLRYPSILTP